MQGALFLPDLNHIWICRQVFIKFRGIRFRGNLPSGSRTDTCGQTDRHDEADRRFQNCARKLCILSMCVVGAAFDA
jgi:hypothetical protein